MENTAKKISKDLMHYLPLFGVLVAGVVGFVGFSYDQYFQVAVIVAVAVAYVAWGVVHHVMHKDFHWDILMEYLVFAFLGLLITLSLILQK